jgi:hypothetical protein
LKIEQTSQGRRQNREPAHQVLGIRAEATAPLARGDFVMRSIVVRSASRSLSAAVGLSCVFVAACAASVDPEGVASSGSAITKGVWGDINGDGGIAWLSARMRRNRRARPQGVAATRMT